MIPLDLNINKSSFITTVLIDVHIGDCAVSLAGDTSSNCFDIVLLEDANWFWLLSYTITNLKSNLNLFVTHENR